MIASPLDSVQQNSGTPDINPEKALAALGNRLRWQMFQMMADGTPMHAAQVARHFDRDFDGISKHLRLMRSAGLLQSRRATDRRVEQYFVPSAFRRMPGHVDLGFCVLRMPSAAPDAPKALPSVTEAEASREMPSTTPLPASVSAPSSDRPSDSAQAPMAPAPEEEEEEIPVQGFGEMLASSALMGSESSD